MKTGSAFMHCGCVVIARACICGSGFFMKAESNSMLNSRLSFTSGICGFTGCFNCCNLLRLHITAALWSAAWTAFA